MQYNLQQRASPDVQTPHTLLERRRIDNKNKHNIVSAICMSLGFELADSHSQSHARFIRMNTHAKSHNHKNNHVHSQREFESTRSTCRSRKKTHPSLTPSSTLLTFLPHALSPLPCPHCLQPISVEESLMFDAKRCSERGIVVSYLHVNSNVTVTPLFTM